MILEYELVQRVAKGLNYDIRKKLFSRQLTNMSQLVNNARVIKKSNIENKK